MIRRLASAGCLTVWLCSGSAAHGQSVNDAIDRGIRYIRSAALNNRNIGEIAVATMALIKSGVPTSDPLVRQLIARIRTVTAGGVYRPQRGAGPDNYEGAVVLMALSAADPQRYANEIQAVVDFLLYKQNNEGVWGYGETGNQGDSSMSQYATLALWEASSLGYDIPMSVWDRTLHWYITRQDIDGGFTYHPRDPKGAGRMRQANVTHSMSAAGTGTMIICRSLLPMGRRLATQQTAKERELLIPVEEIDGFMNAKRQEYELKTSREQADASIDRAEKWLANNFTVADATGPVHYYLYGIERYASFARRDTIGGFDWYRSGADFLVANQKASGAWTGKHQPIVDTSFAVLFLSRATKKTIDRFTVNLLGEGTMLGGRGIPTGDSADNLTIARKKNRYRQALRAPVEDLLAVLVDPDAIEVKEAADAMEHVDPAALIRVLGGDVRRIRPLASNRRPEIRRAALWALARSRDVRVAPVLIDALSDKDVEVYKAARDGLRHLSRRIEGFGLPEKPPEEVKLTAGIKKWRAWFDSLLVELKPEDEFGTAFEPEPPKIAPKK